MKGTENMIRRITQEMDLEGACLPGQCIVEIAGENRVLIEGHFGVREYTRERIGVNVKYGVLQVHGCSLEMTRMTREQLVISGRIDCVQLLRRGEP